MIWLTWRQFRAQAIAAVAALAAFAMALAVTRPRMDSLYAASGITGCHGGCAGPADTFLNQLASAAPFGGRDFHLLPAGFDLYPFMYGLGIVVILAAPAIIGIFWGAPLIARELETGTCRLAWNQTVTRTRWLTVKLVLVGVAAMAFTEALSLIQAWWAAPIGRAVGLGGGASLFSEGRFGSLVFATHGITPLGYAAFGFVLGVTAGVLFRRAVPAMAVTLAIFAAVQVVVPLWVRPHLLPPDHTIVTTQSAYVEVTDSGGGPALTATVVPGHPRAWLLSSGAVNEAGQPVSKVPAACVPGLEGAAGAPGNSTPSEQGLQRCLDSHGIREAISYQPASRFWPFQWIETAIYLVLACALAGYCFRRLNRRLS